MLSSGTTLMGKSDWDAHLLHKSDDWLYDCMHALYIRKVLIPVRIDANRSVH